MKNYVLSLLVENNSGVLLRICSLFGRRGYNIESLSVGETEDKGVSRITIVTFGDEKTVDQIIKQASKLVEVINITRLNGNCVSREMMLIKVSTMRETRAEILEIVNIFRARVIDVSSSSLIIEATGTQSKLEALVEMLAPFTILELARTGLSALERGSAPFKTADPARADEI